MTQILNFNFTSFNIDGKTDILGYACCIDLKQIFNELCDTYESKYISMGRVFRWVKSFKDGKLSVKDDTYIDKHEASIIKIRCYCIIIIILRERVSAKDTCSSAGVSKDSAWKRSCT